MNWFVPSVWTIAFEWNDEGVNFLAVRRGAKGGRCRVVGDNVLFSPEDDAPRRTEKFLAALADNHVGRGPAIGILTRQDVDLMELDLPPAEEQEVPAFVENLVQQQAADLPDSAIVDHLVTGQVQGGKRKAVAFVARQESVAPLREACRQAGWRLTQVVFRPLASAALLQAHTSGRGPCLVVAPGAHESDVVLLRQGRVVLTRTARLPDPEDDGYGQQLAAELRRTMLVAAVAVEELASQDEVQEVQHVYLVGSTNDRAELANLLSQELNLPVSFFDPLEFWREGDKRIGVACDRLPPLAGAIYGHANDSAFVDFLHPRSPPPAPNRWRRAAAYASMALIVAAALLFLHFDRRAEQLAKIDDLSEQLDEVEQLLERVERRETLVLAVDQWQQDDVSWLDELHDLTTRFPERDRFAIQRLVAGAGRDGTPSVQIQVRVTEPEVLQTMERRLRDDYHEVRSERVAQRAGSDPWSWQFESQIRVKPRSRDEYLGLADVEPDEVEPNDEFGAVAADQPGDQAGDAVDEPRQEGPR